MSRDIGLDRDNLRDADLRRADLRGKHLHCKDLRGANLTGADLHGADLGNADLSYANLTGADLRGADLSNADLSYADLTGADLRGADLKYARLHGADLRGAILPGDVPVVKGLDAAILAAISPGGKRLDMSRWHSECGTVHCRAGWTIVLAGDAGKALEARFGTNAAAALIYAASTPGGCIIPDWFASRADALADLRRRAAKAEVGPNTEPETSGPESRLARKDLHCAYLSGENLFGADLSGANLVLATLSGADLSGADLHGADLGNADLSDANCCDADFTGAKLIRAVLRGAYLCWADLGEADLRDADLGGARLRFAHLANADMSGANLSGADLRNADLNGANLSGVDLRGALLPDDVPVVPHVDAAILAAVGPDGERLDMSESRSDCGTKHDRAGWAIVLAGEAGRRLEEKLGTNAAAALIYAASTPGGCVVPDWHASIADTLADIRQRMAAAEAEPEIEPGTSGPEMR